ncbi:MAG: NADH-quinone oxidoreductase subunit K [Verrucomicrobiales bacterium]
MDFIQQKIIPYFNYWVYVVIMMIGLWAMISKRNLIKKLIGMSIFQTAIILLYVSAGVKKAPRSRSSTTKPTCNTITAKRSRSIPTTIRTRCPTSSCSPRSLSASPRWACRSGDRAEGPR